jgi:short-subunit dehydrogenase
MKKAIIIGASTGIGRALAIEMSKAGYELGLVARRKELLESLQKELPNKSYIQTMDIAQTTESRQALESLIQTMGGMDIIVLNSAVGLPDTSWEDANSMIQINIAGTVALAQLSLEYFKKQGSGHIVGISSVAKHRAFRSAIVYSATKSFLSAYLQGIRHYVVRYKKNITISDIRPGYVETPMTSQNDPKSMFWVEKVEVAAQYILRAIEQKKSVAYIRPRWWFAAQFMQFLPDFIFHRM